MSQDIQVRGAQGVGGAQANAADLEPGALTGFDDGAWAFTGNGETTPTQVCGRIIEVEAERDQDLLPFCGNQDAARLAAQNNLRRNAQLSGQSADAPVPRGEQFHVEGGPSLKQLLAPFKDNLDSLKQAIAQQMEGGMAPQKNPVTGNVRSLGLGLPIDF